MPRLLALILIVLSAAASSADAQKRCVKGKPCGNTCIAANRTCKVGSGSASSGQAPAATKPQDPAPPADARFVASSRGRVYYVLSCYGATQLAPANRIYFRTEEEAQAAGYTPSAARGCSTESVVPIPAPLPSGGEASPATSGECVLSRVYDGDTVTCRSGESIRLLLIDTPEMDQGEFGRRSRAALLELAPLGSTVRLEHDIEQKDRYGRTLAYLWLADGRLLNEELARAGYALALTYPPNVRYVDRIRAAVEEARAAGRGLWSSSAFECTPRDHRAKKCN